MQGRDVLIAMPLLHQALLQLLHEVADGQFQLHVFCCIQRDPKILVVQSKLEAQGVPPCQHARGSVFEGPGASGPVL